MFASERPLLVGLLALEQDWITAGDLVEAFRQWRQTPATPLGKILADRGRLTPERLGTLQRQADDSESAHSLPEPTIDWSPPTTKWELGSSSANVDDSPSASLNNSKSASGAITTFSAAARTASRYRPLRLHAQGGLGRVYIAEDTELHRQVALKEIHPDAADDRGSRYRFVAEAEITGRLEHPGIVPVYGLGADREGRPSYAMRFIEGENLAAAIERFHVSGPRRFVSLEFRKLLSRVVGVCNAIGFAHSKGIIHRDLKPHNVMLGPFGETLVVDWGLAKSLHPDPSDESEVGDPSRSRADDDEFATVTGEAVGTPAYMSPEQRAGRNQDVGTASDVYGLGAVLYVLLTGHSPAHGRSSTDVKRHRLLAIPPPRQLQPSVPRPLGAVCQKALASDPADRYASALELAADIERWLADEPVAAYQEPWFDRAYRWMRKHRLPVAVASALVVVTAIATSIGYVLVRKERDIARYERGQAVVANQRAQENAASTRQVVEQFLIQVGDDRWSEIPGFEDVRLEMVKLAAERYRALVAQQVGDVALRADAAMVFRRCGNLYRMMGHWQESRRLYEDSVAIYRSLGTTGSGDAPEGQHPRGQHLCEAMNELADLVLRLNGPQQAEPLLRDAIAIGLRARELDSRNMAGRQAEARAKGDLADTLRRLGRSDEALRGARDAHAVMRIAAQRESTNPVNQVCDVYYAINLARVLRELGRYDEALERLDVAHRHAQEYLALRPRDTNLNYLEAAGSLERSFVLQLQQPAGPAWHDELRHATALLAELVERFPATKSFRLTFSDALIASGKQSFAERDLPAALDFAHRALAELQQADPGEEPAAITLPLRAAAERLAGETELALANRSEAGTRLQAALEHLRAAAQGNPNPRLAVEINEIESMVGALP